MPEAAPVPASPTKLPLPILLENKEAPTCKKRKSFRNPDKSAYWKIIFFISHPKHMLWVLKRTVSMRRFF